MAPLKAIFSNNSLALFRISRRPGECLGETAQYIGPDPTIFIKRVAPPLR